VTGEDVIWHVVIGGEQHGPLSRAQVLEYLHDEQLVGTDLIWRPGFSDWKSISEVADFWQPPKRGSLRPPPMPAPTEQPERDNDQINAVATNKKWSIWRAANAGLLVSVLPLALQIANGRGVELASYAQTARAHGRPAAGRGVFRALPEGSVSDGNRELAPSAVGKHRIHDEAAT
jgi:GYF domain 2